MSSLVNVESESNKSGRQTCGCWKKGQLLQQLNDAVTKYLILKTTKNTPLKAFARVKNLPHTVLRQQVMIKTAKRPYHRPCTKNIDHHKGERIGKEMKKTIGKQTEANKKEYYLLIGQVR